jgi:hypothetical protein
MLLRGTRVENPVEGVAQVFAKIPGGSRLSWKIAKGGPPISGFIAFLLKSVLKFVWGVLNLQSTFPPPPLLCVRLCGPNGKYLSRLHLTLSFLKYKYFYKEKIW